MACTRISGAAPPSNALPRPNAMGQANRQQQRRRQQRQAEEIPVTLSAIVWIPNEGEEQIEDCGNAKEIGN